MADEEQVEEKTVNVDYTKSIQDRAKKVSDLLLKNDFGPALLASLEDPPLQNKDDKRDAAKPVGQVLERVKEADIPKLLDSLDQEKLDLLMKYIYRCLETSEANSLMLFKWHKAVLAKTGPGSVVRALIEKKTV